MTIKESGEELTKLTTGELKSNPLTISETVSVALDELIEKAPAALLLSGLV
jgi:hypothetical protein